MAPRQLYLRIPTQWTSRFSTLGEFFRDSLYRRAQVDSDQHCRCLMSFATCVVAPRFASRSSPLFEPPDRSRMCQASSCDASWSRAVLEPWFGRAKYGRSQIAPKLLFRVQAEEGGELFRLKVEINYREAVAFDAPVSLPFEVSNGWFSGEASVSAFSPEETLATKLLTLLRRSKARDLFNRNYSGP